MTDEFKNTETAAISTELPGPGDPLCLVLIFACK